VSHRLAKEFDDTGFFCESFSNRWPWRAKEEGMKKMLRYGLALGLVALNAGTCLAEGPKLVAEPMATAPTLDGKADEWKAVTPITVKVVPATAGDEKAFQGNVDLELKAATNGDMIYILAQWADKTKDDTHKTLTWNKEKDGYEEGKDREDRMALDFPISGDFTACMLSGKTFVADVWHWKAYRSQIVGLAEDQSHIFSADKLEKAKEHPTRDGKKIWVARPADTGTPLVSSQKPIDNIGDVIPQYLPNKAISGSIADIKSAAVWADGKWTVEMSRKLSTSNKDDVAFAHGKTYAAGAAVFDHTGDDHHSFGEWSLEIK